MKTRKKLYTLIISLMCVGALSFTAGCNSIKKYLENGDYISAYELADESEKPAILEENAIGSAYYHALGSETIKSIFVNPTLLNGWYETDSKKVVIQTISENTDTDTYVYYRYDEDKNSYDVICIVGESMSTDDCHILADLSNATPLGEKAVKISVIQSLQEVIKNGEKLEKTRIDNINYLFANNKLTEELIKDEEKK